MEKTTATNMPKTPEQIKQDDLMEMVDRINRLSTADCEKIAENIRKIIEERQQKE